MDPVAKEQVPEGQAPRVPVARRNLLDAAPFLHRSKPLSQVIRDAGRAAVSSSLVLLSGESGTGKGRLARFMHDRSGRSGRFVTWCAPETQGQILLSSIFGYRRGAFTDAKTDSQGLFRLAHEGTLFADEIDKLEAAGQPALLKFMDDRLVRPLGDEKSSEVDVFLIAATNRNLDSLAERGHFLPDLANRLSGIQIRIPPLRERVEDVAVLAEHFAREYGLLYLNEPATLTSRAIRLLQMQHWPSNVRGLVKVIENAVFRASTPCVDEKELLHELGLQSTPSESPHEELARLVALPIEARCEREVIRRAIELVGGSGKKAALALQIPLRTFRRLTRAHQIFWRAQ